MNKPSDKEKIIQQQANLIKEKEKAAEMFEEKERYHAEMAKRLEESEATSTRATKKLSENQKIIQEQGNLIKEKEKESSTDGTSAKYKEILSAQENLKKKVRAHDIMATRLEIADALSTCTVNELSEKEKIIQEQAKLIEEKEKEGSSDALRAKDKEVMAASEKLEKEVLAHVEIVIRLEESWVISTRAMKKPSKKQKLVQEQSRVIVGKKGKARKIWQL